MTTLKKLSSWMGVFTKTGIYQEIDSEIEIRKMVLDKEDFQIIGSLHSYNSLALKGYKSVKLVGDEFKSIYLNDDETVTFGAGVTIVELMKYLVELGYRLRNSGNHRQQTMIGAILGGTHGFGENASLASSVVDYEYVDNKGFLVLSNKVSLMPSRKVILYCTIKVEKLAPYRVEANQMYLNNLRFVPGERKAFLVLPYTNESNPIVIETCYYNDVGEKQASSKKAWDVPWSAWKLKLFWALDSRFRCFRKVLQRALYFFRIPSWEIVTDPKDIDSLYHPWPGLDDITNKPRFSLWAFKPTYTGYNISLFVREDDAKRAIRSIVNMANNSKQFGMPSNFMMSFLACRYLSDKTNIKFVGNYKQRMVAIDMYCHPKHAEHLIKVQRRLQKIFVTRSHRGKTV